VPHVSEDDNGLEIDVIERGSTPVVVLTGELDPHTAPRFAQALDPLQRPDIEQIVVDLAGVRFIDSSGLRVLIAAEHELSERGARLVLRAPSPAARRLLEITDLIDRLNVE
jgi:anti-anti-sigma factor